MFIPCAVKYALCFYAGCKFYRAFFLCMLKHNYFWWFFFWCQAKMAGIENSVKVCPWCGVGLLPLYFLYCGVLNKLTLLLGSAAPVKRKGARGEVRFPRRPHYYVPCSI